MIFLEWQFGGENQMLLKCAYVAILPLGIHSKELFPFREDVCTKILRAILFKLARIGNHLNARQLRIS